MNVAPKEVLEGMVGDARNVPKPPVGEAAPIAPTKKEDQADSRSDNGDLDDFQDGSEEEEEEEDDDDDDDSFQWHGGIPRARVVPTVKGNPDGPNKAKAKPENKDDKTKNAGPSSKPSPKPVKTVKDHK